MKKRCIVLLKKLIAFFLFCFYQLYWYTSLHALFVRNVKCFKYCSMYLKFSTTMLHLFTSSIGIRLFKTILLSLVDISQDNGIDDKAFSVWLRMDVRMQRILPKIEVVYSISDLQSLEPM